MGIIFLLVNSIVVMNKRSLLVVLNVTKDILE